jgi:hypothetical protein
VWIVKIDKGTSVWIKTKFIPDDKQGLLLRVFSLIFNNILVISWLSVLLAEKSGTSGEITHLQKTTDKIFHAKLHRHGQKIRLV